MQNLMKVILAVLVGALCSCNASSGSAGKEPQSAVKPQPTASPEKIREILVVAQGSEATPQNRFAPVSTDSPISVTVSVTRSGADAPAISLRLIDLKNGQVLGEQSQLVTADVDSVQFVFKPTQPWSEGRHLLEARLGKAGKVVQREFDVVQSQPVVAAKVGAKSS
ncbi:hypothetical protein [Xanthomonas oryzae]|uniref:hypothetical protein n=1 Tax=Xanthomonas oryzae TaxID=347 RepID=UPI000B28D7B7|nr:hypothetical protein [Xanthomonas oryzae]QBG85694.1 hypothetical protein EYR27_20265 [Xanthomonas oryzae]